MRTAQVTCRNCSTPPLNPETQGIVDNWYLVSLVDNNFIDGDLYSAFDLN